MEYSQEELNKLGEQISWIVRKIAEERYGIEWNEEFRKVANFAFNTGITAERNKAEIPMVMYYTSVLNAVSRKDRTYSASNEEIEKWREEVDKILDDCQKADRETCEKFKAVLSTNTQEN